MDLFSKMNNIDIITSLEALELGSTSNETSFTCFPDLPLEIRLKIFAHILNQPHTLRLGWHDLRRLPQPLLRPYCIQSPVLSLCRESRAEALRIYALSNSFDRYYFHADLHINFEHDTIFLDSMGAFQYFLEHTDSLVRDQIRYLTLTTDAIFHDLHPAHNEEFANSMLKFRNIDHFRLLILPALFEPHHFSQHDYMRCWITELEWAFRTSKGRDVKWKYPEWSIEVSPQGKEHLRRPYFDWHMKFTSHDRRFRRIQGMASHWL